MVTTLTHGIATAFVAVAATAIVQSAELTAKIEESTVSGMVSGVTQIVKTFAHSTTNEFSVSGKGDITVVPEVTATVADANFGSGFITGGKITIKDFKFTQKIGEPSEWSYSGTHYPSAS